MVIVVVVAEVEVIQEMIVVLFSFDLDVQVGD
jgi:hypothetical protein